MTPTKQCFRCKGTKPVTDFGRNRFRKDGLKSYCRPCQSIVETRWRSTDPEKHRKRGREDYRKNPEPAKRNALRYYYERHADICAARREDRRQNKAKYREYYCKHRADNQARGVLYRERNPEKVAASYKRWVAANPEKRRVTFRRARINRAARMRAGFVEYICPQLIFERDGGICRICGKPVNPNSFHIDHIKPIALGGEHSFDNTQLAHPRCNMSKGAKYGGTT